MKNLSDEVECGVQKYAIALLKFHCTKMYVKYTEHLQKRNKRKKCKPAQENYRNVVILSLDRFCSVPSCHGAEAAAQKC